MKQQPTPQAKHVPASPQGIYTGGLAHANEMVLSGRAQAREFRLLNGYSFWPKGALDLEVARGSWWLIAASPAYILSLIQGNAAPCQ